MHLLQGGPGSISSVEAMFVLCRGESGLGMWCGKPVGEVVLWSEWEMKMEKQE
jgi:hypothetical protein